YAPEVQAPLVGVWASKRHVATRLQRAYGRVPSVSVDVAVMQRLTATADRPIRVAVLRADFDWSDVGSWGAMPEIWGGDKDGNAAVGKIVPIEAGDSVVYAPGRLVALFGVRGLIVVDSPDALLICQRERAQEVGRVTRALKQRGWVQYL